MKRVLLCSPFKGPIGGISRWTGHIYEYYNINKSSLNIDLKIFSLSRSQAIHANTNFVKRIVLGLCDYIIICFKFLIELYKVKPEIVHIVSSGSVGLVKDIFFLLFSMLFNKKTIIHFRFGRIPQVLKGSGWEKFLLKVVLDLSDKVIVIDKATYDFLVKYFDKKIYYLPNPLNPTLIQLASESNFDRKPRTLLFAGHVVPTKGVFELIESTMGIDNLEIKFAGYCSNNMMAEIERMVKDVRDKYTLLGELDYKNTIEQMLQCDIFVFPSHTEGFPNVILEAMACECPIIATNVGAIPEMLDFNTRHPCGLEINVNDVENLKQSIVSLLDNTDYKKMLGKKSKIKVLDNYTIQTIWNKMENIWFDVNL